MQRFSAEMAPLRAPLRAPDEASGNGRKTVEFNR